jgi:glutaredoxin
MWIVGGVWALKKDWSVMELTCQRCHSRPDTFCPRYPAGAAECLIARIPARELRPFSKPGRPQPRARPIILIAGQDEAGAASHEHTIVGALALGASLPDCVSAGKWLNAHSPDAAIIDVDTHDKSCTDLARKLTAREIPFIVISGHTADVPGLHRLFRPVPWLGKPVTSASLQLALRSIL